MGLFLRVFERQYLVEYVEETYKFLVSFELVIILLLVCYCLVLIIRNDILCKNC